MSWLKLTEALLLGGTVGATVTVGGGDPEPRPIIRGAPPVAIMPGPIPVDAVDDESAADWEIEVATPPPEPQLASKSARIAIATTFWANDDS